MVTEITKGVKVSAEAYYQPEHSDPQNEEFVFAYRITIENFNDHPVQLLKRKWIIFDSNGEYTHVEGEGVLGRQPVLEPEESHQYVSGCNLKTELGSMEGSYLFKNKVTGTYFEVVIPKFKLVAPFKLN